MLMATSLFSVNAFASNHEKGDMHKEHRKEMREQHKNLSKEEVLDKLGKHKEKLKERNPKWINDDYVKFIRFGSHLIEKNGEGILAFINPHGYLDNPNFRGMRWHLMKTFDKVYIIDLHGNAKKKETAPDGSADQNVFDIMQGVSINLFVKKENRE